MDSEIRWRDTGKINEEEWHFSEELEFREIIAAPFFGSLKQWSYFGLTFTMTIIVGLGQLRLEQVDWLLECWNIYYVAQGAKNFFTHWSACEKILVSDVCHIFLEYRIILR